MTVKELVENVTKFEMESFGYLGTRTLIFERSGGERTVRCEGCAYVFEEYYFAPKTLTEEEWDNLFGRIFGECGVMKYPKEFENNDLILDGETWSMHIEFANRRAKNSGGYNAYPDNWNLLAKALAAYDGFYDYEEEESGEYYDGE